MACFWADVQRADVGCGVTYNDMPFYGGFIVAKRLPGVGVGVIYTSADQRSVYFSKTSDLGVSWSTPVAVYSGSVALTAATENSFMSGPDGSLHFVAVLSSSAGNPIVYARSSDIGASWAVSAFSPWQGRLPPYVSKPGLLHDGSNLYVAWNETIAFSTGTVYVAKSTDSGVSWAAPTSLFSEDSSVSGHDRNISLASGKNGVAGIVEMRGVTGVGVELRSYVTSNGGVTWSAVSSLDAPSAIWKPFSDTGWCTNLRECNLGGIINGVWHAFVPLQKQVSGGPIHFFHYRSLDYGATWLEPVMIPTVDFRNLSLGVVTDYSSHFRAVVTVLDTEGDDEYASILAFRSADAGASWQLSGGDLTPPLGGVVGYECLPKSCTLAFDNALDNALAVIDDGSKFICLSF